jgi:PAS domain S-box-containing protein
LEEALRERAEDYAQLLDRVPGLLFTTTPQGEVEFVNQPLLRYFGRTLEDLQTWKQAEHVHPEDLPHTIELWSAAIASGGHCTIEQRLRREDGSYRWFQFDASPHHDAEGRVVRWYGTLTDIDNMKRQAAEIREMQARLSRASQMAGVSQLSAAIAHEVKQPLAAVLSNSDACQRWLSAEPPNFKRAIQSLRRVSRDAMAAGDVIERVRLLFRHAPAAREPLNLNAVTKEVLQMMGEELRSNGVTLTMELDPALPDVQGDRVQMQQVVSNLVRNAIEAMTGLAPSQKKLLIGSRAERDQVIVRVTDNGPGVKDPDIIFEPFYTTKGSGMGMGLAISRSIVEAHSGRLWLTSPLGRGVTFSLELAGRAAGE